MSQDAEDLAIDKRVKNITTETQRHGEFTGKATENY
jgi:hypothetical protein